MAHSLSAKKRIRQSLKRRARNRSRKETIKQEIKTFLSAVTSGDFAKAGEEFKKVTRILDRVSTKGAIHRNTASRKRSRLAKRLNAAKAAKAAGGTGAGTTAKT